jgi:integrase/recombinase XerD
MQELRAMTLSHVLFETTLLTGQLAKHSLLAYRADLRAYLAFCSDLATALEASSLARWRVHLAQDTRLAASTINRRLAAVKRVVQETAVQGSLAPSTAEAFRRVPGVPSTGLTDRLRGRARMTPGQMRRLCEAPDLATLSGWRDRALLATLAGSGCRVSEVVTLTTQQIRVTPGHYVLEVSGKHQVAARLAPLSQEAYRRIAAWLTRRPVASAYVFTSFAGKGTRPTPQLLHRSSAWRIVTSYARALGFHDVSPHVFRRFVGTAIATKKGIRQAQKALGHARIETTVRHSVLDDLTGGLTDGLY